MNRVLESIIQIIERSEHVRIDSLRLKDFCSTIKPADLSKPEDRSLFDLGGCDVTSRLDFAIIFNSINFCYWGEPKWTIDHGVKRLDGAIGLVTALRRAIDFGYPLLSCSYLEKMPEGTLRKILQGSNVDIPLFSTRLAILHEIGRVLKDRYDGHIKNGFKWVDHDALDIVDAITTDFPSYNDSARYSLSYNASTCCRQHDVVFNKRAQLAVAEIHDILVSAGLAPLKRMEELTAFADYKVPQVLRKIGILRYSDILSRRVDADFLLDSGSQEEIEIRANMVWAVHLMRGELLPRFPRVTEVAIDHYLWRLSQVKSPEDKPYHKTCCIFY